MNRRSILAALLSLPAGFASASSARPPVGGVNPGFPARLHRGLLFVAAVVNGRRTRLIIDSGAESTTLDCALVGLLPSDLAAPRTQGVAGVVHSVTRRATVELNPAVRFEVDAAVLDLSFAARALGAAFGGLLGADVLSRFARVTLAYSPAPELILSPEAA